MHMSCVRDLDLLSMIFAVNSHSGLNSDVSKKKIRSCRGPVHHDRSIARPWQMRDCLYRAQCPIQTKAWIMRCNLYMVVVSNAIRVSPYLQEYHLRTVPFIRCSLYSLQLLPSLIRLVAQSELIVRTWQFQVYVTETCMANRDCTLSIRINN